MRLNLYCIRSEALSPRLERRGRVTCSATTEILHKNCSSAGQQCSNQATSKMDQAQIVDIAPQRCCTQGFEAKKMLYRTIQCHHKHNAQKRKTVRALTSNAPIKLQARWIKLQARSSEALIRYLSSASSATILLTEHEQRLPLSLAATLVKQPVLDLLKAGLRADLRVELAVLPATCEMAI